MHFVVFEAHPKPHHPEYGQVDGAFVSAFVNEPIAAAAEATVRAFIEDQGWDVAELDQCASVERNFYEQGSDGLEHFDQALIDGIVVTFHRWPVGAQDEDSDGSAA